MFEKATRLKYRFVTPRGNVSTEDLWDLPLVSSDGLSLDDTAKALSREISVVEEESFVVQKSKVNETLESKLDIVKHVIAFKLNEIETRENEVERKAKKEKILSIIAGKEDDSLKSKSVASLKKMAGEL